MSEVNPRLEALKKSRPKAGSYKTFTSRKKNSHINFQKPRYTGGEKGTQRVLVDDPVKLVIQLGIEFDAWTACLGSADGKIKPSPILHKLVVNGFKKDGKTVFLDPKDLQAKLEDRKESQDNRIIYWEDRERSEQEKTLEKALQTKEVTIDRLASMLKGKGVKEEEIEAALKG